jgi:hypothetical protein
MALGPPDGIGSALWGAAREHDEHGAFSTAPTSQATLTVFF